MKVEVTANFDEVGRVVQHIFSDQLPFATSLAVNWTALDFQREQRERMHDVFTIRRKRFAERSVKIKPFATKEEPQARVSIDSPGGRSDIFAKFETDTSKGPFRGNSIAVPTEHVKRTQAGVIRKNWRPRQLLEGATQHGAGRVFRSKGNVFRGKRAFLIRKPGGRGTIFMREGGEIKPLYQLVPRVRIDPDLEFVGTAEKTVDKRWQANFTRAFDRAIGIGR